MEENNPKLKPLFPTTPPLTDEQAALTDKSRRREYFKKSLRRGAIELALLLCLIVGGPVSYYHFTRLPFNSSQWKAAQSYEKQHIRRRMCADLRRNNRLVGLHRSEIILMYRKTRWGSRP
jgi:hypothetical protein